MSIRVAISGYAGRMGQAIAKLAYSDSIFSIVGALEQSGQEAIGMDAAQLLGESEELGFGVTDDAQSAFCKTDVIIEFTSPEATVEHTVLAKKLGKAIVIGTTGMSDGHREIIKNASKSIPVVLSPNMSVGVNVLFELSRLASRVLGGEMEIEVVEAHHKFKKDSPSGTAKRLVEVLQEGLEDPKRPIPVHAIRAGGIIGDHTVVIAGAAERVELTHRAQSRDVFAQGALRAARYLKDRQPGLYDMVDVLGLRTPVVSNER